MVQSSISPSVRNFAKNCKLAMRRANLTQVDLSERSGVTIQTINRILNERIAPRVDTLDLLANALNTPLAKLLS